MIQKFRVNYTNFQQENIINVPFDDVGLLHLMNLVNMHLTTTQEIMQEADNKKDKEFRAELKDDLDRSGMLMVKLIQIAKNKNLIEND